MSDTARSQSTTPAGVTASVPTLAARLGPRVDSLDLLRGLAILGIFLMNTQSMLLPAEAYYNPNEYMVGRDATHAGDYLRSFGGPGADLFTRIGVWIFGPHLNAAAYIFTHLFADTKFITIFSFMFGAGIMLQGERVASRGMSAAVIHYRRMAILLCIALFHAYFIWYGDILTEYALCGLILFPLRRLYPPLLMGLGVLCVAMGLMYLVAKYSDITFDDYEHGNTVRAEYSDGHRRAGDYASVFPLDWVDKIVDKIETQFDRTDDQGNPLFDQNGQKLRLTEPDAFIGDRPVLAYDDQGNPYTRHEVVYWKDEIRYRTLCSLFSQFEEYPKWSFWRCGGCMLVGMALLRWKFFHGAWGKPAYWTIALVCIPTGIAISALGIAYNAYIGLWEYFLLHKFGGLFNYVGSFIQALGYMCVGVLLAMRIAEAGGAASATAGLFDRLLRTAMVPIRSVGKMALSNYLFQSIVGTTLAYGHRVSENVQFGFGWYGTVDRYRLLGIVACVWTAQLTLSTIYLRFFKQGPVEWAWHKLAYLGKTFPERPAERSPAAAPISGV